MPVIDRKNVLSGLRVRDAMRRAVIRLSHDATLEKAVRHATKYKVNAILVTDRQQRALGVVSKTDLMGAYYAELPITAPVETIMVGPPLTCRITESLDSALDMMRTSNVHRLYVIEDEPEWVIGVLAYPDIVGILYRFCRKCRKSIMNRSGSEQEILTDHLRVRDIMTLGAKSRAESDTLGEVMEALSTHRLGAVLIYGEDERPVGVVSKTDLILAYKHGIPSAAPAREIMNSPVRSCSADEPLIMATRMMIFSDIHRLFTYQEHWEKIVGVLALSDVARARSGSCHACVTSRIEIGTDP